MKVKTGYYVVGYQYKSGNNSGFGSLKFELSKPEHKPEVFMERVDQIIVDELDKIGIMVRTDQVVVLSVSRIA